MTETETASARSKALVGEVVSDSMTKTIVVQVGRRVRHPQYKKIVTKFKRYYAHDEEGTAAVGDTVRILSTRPLSKLKRWRLDEVIRKAHGAGA